MFRHPKKLLVAGAGMLMLSGGMRAHAASETFTSTSPDQQTDFSTTLSLPQFNPALGTLLSVSLTYGEDVTNSGSLTNDGGGNKILTYTFTGTSELTQSGLGIDQTSSVTETGSLPVSGTPVNINDSQSKTGGPVTGPLAFFKGGGVIDFTLTGTGTSVLSGGGNIADNVNTYAGGFVSVTYNYTPVPEASTLIGLGGLLGIGGLQLRRLMRKKA